MKKFFLIISIFVASFFCYTITSAQLNQKQQTGGQKTIIKFASYVDYFPISKIDNIKSIPSYEGVFDNFIKDMCDSYHYECQPFINNNYIQTIKYYSPSKMKAILSHLTHVNLEDIGLNEISQSQKVK